MVHRAEAKGVAMEEAKRRAKKEDKLELAQFLIDLDEFLKVPE